MKRIRLISSDIDGTLAGDRQASLRFAAFWNGIPADMRPLLVYNSGRLVDDILDYTAAEGLPAGDYVIGGVGTMMSCAGDPLFHSDYAMSLAQGYDAAAISEIIAAIPGIERQPARYQHERKSSWYLRDATRRSLDELEARLDAAGMNVKIVYSSNRDLDILPANADKGLALTWLCERLQIGLDEVVVAGDTGNDAGMFALPQVRGIVPGNGLDELRRRFAEGPRFHHAAGEQADGVIEGLRRWLPFSTADGAR